MKHVRARYRDAVLVIGKWLSPLLAIGGALALLALVPRGTATAASAQDESGYQGREAGVTCLSIPPRMYKVPFTIYDTEYDQLPLSSLDTLRGLRDRDLKYLAKVTAMSYSNMRALGLSEERALELLRFYEGFDTRILEETAESCTVEVCGKTHTAERGLLIVDQAPFAMGLGPGLYDDDSLQLVRCRLAVLFLQTELALYDDALENGSWPAQPSDLLSDYYGTSLVPSLSTYVLTNEGALPIGLPTVTRDYKTVWCWLLVF